MPQMPSLTSVSAERSWLPLGRIKVVLMCLHEAETQPSGGGKLEKSNCLSDLSVDDI